MCGELTPGHLEKAHLLHNFWHLRINRFQKRLFCFGHPCKISLNDRGVDTLDTGLNLPFHLLNQAQNHVTPGPRIGGLFIL